jgi:thiol-disulfide isomerase/thioredoxin
MKPILFALVVGCVSFGVALADDAPKTPATPSLAEVTANLEVNPNDVTTFNLFINESLRSIAPLTQSKFDEAEKKLDEFKKVLDSLEPTEAPAKAALARARALATSYADIIATNRTPLSEFEKQLDANPGDAKVLGKYVRKISNEVGSMARTKPVEAEAILTPAQERITKIKEATDKSDEGKKAEDLTPEEKSLRTQLQLAVRTMTSLERAVENGHKLLALIGKDSVPIVADAWVNGSPLTTDDLKGKVVLLDFWAIWCGPCIATFPHLREWNEKYSDKGLVMIGMTRYYKYEWDEKAGRAVKAKGEVTSEAEQEMLVKFAEHHKLHHRFALQKNEDSLADDYAVTGIPHVVVIDRQGKVRLIRVGSGDANAKDIEEMLEKLLKEPAAAAGG